MPYIYVKNQARPITEGVIVAIIGLLSVVLGQTLVELLKKFLGRAKETADQNLGIRDELRIEIQRKEVELAALRAENKQLDEEKDRWRVDYFKLYYAFYELKALAVGLLHRSGDSTMELPEAPTSRGAEHEQKE